MAQTTTKTNNSYLADKVALRSRNLPKGKTELNVLDCYGGQGRIWTAVQLQTGREINVLPIDVKDYGDFFMPGDNRSFLSIIDLSRFQVVDLDAYGVPYDQLKILFEREYHGLVFVTFIQTLYGIMPKELLADLGFSNEMVDPSRLCLQSRDGSISKNGWRCRGFPG